MTSRKTILWACLGLLVAAAAEPAFGQLPSRRGVRRPYASPLSRPTLSPYLNLLRQDGSPASNYYTLVRPQLRQQATNIQLNQQLMQQDQQLGDLRQTVEFGAGQTGLAPTGRGASFMNYSHYYSFGGGGGGQSRRSTASLGSTSRGVGIGSSSYGGSRSFGYGSLGR